MLFFSERRFVERVDAVAREFAADPIVGKIVAFIRAGGSRPLMKARVRRGAGKASDDTDDGHT
jgi:hypothetical protein